MFSEKRACQCCQHKTAFFVPASVCKVNASFARSNPPSFEVRSYSLTLVQIDQHIAYILNRMFLYGNVGALIQMQRIQLTQYISIHLDNGLVPNNDIHVY